ncbi:MAG TPA: HigA family addiction module antitoxin [Aquirhabdus sp.]
MYNPAHPGKLIEEYINGLKEEGVSISISQLAKHIGVTRATMSRIVNGHQAVTPDIALRLKDALGISPELLLKMQMGRDLWEGQQRVRPIITPIYAHA